MDDIGFKYHIENLSLVSTIAPPFKRTSETYDLNTVKGRREYFKVKAGKLIDKISQFLENHTFIAYWLAPKNAGKSTYIGLLRELLGQHTFNYIAVGDIVREFQKEYKQKAQEYDSYFLKHYRGYLKLNEAVEALLHPDVSKLKPTELILTLVKKKIDTLPRKTLFIDGFPRTEDQVSYSLYFRELINYRNDPDVFVMIYLPLSVIDERIKYRRVCPKCGKSFSTVLLPSEHVKYDAAGDEFVFMCDNPACNKEVLIKKQGDDKGIEPLMPRIKKDLYLMQLAEKLYGVPKIKMYNAIEVKDADNLVQDYEITERYSFEYKNGKIIKRTSPWVVKDNGKNYYSLLAAPVLLQFLRQLSEIFEIT